jgi:uncharacterized protein YjiK
MVKKIFLFICISCLFFACTRNEPVSSASDTSVTALTLVAQYSTTVSEPSGLYFNSKTNSLWTVSDGNSTVYEIDFQGKVLKSLAISSSDLEGITFSANCDTFYVAEETNQLITKYLTNGTKLSSFPVNVATMISHGPEGLTLNTTNNHIFIINEKSPCMLLEYNNSKLLWQKQIDYTLDCSDIYFDKQLNCLWMVSDESSKVIKMSLTGDLLAEYSVPITKMEGITIYQDKIYLINDQNGILYVFQKP